jgi:RNA polymerase sigma factor (sigma-70 family)
MQPTFFKLCALTFLQTCHDYASRVLCRSGSCRLVIIGAFQCRRRAEKHVPLGEEDGETSPTNGSLSTLPDEMLVQVEKEQIVRDAITELSPRCERMVRMLFFETPPRPYEEIAQELDIATGSIGFIRGRCLGKLKQQLENMGF